MAIGSKVAAFCLASIFSSGCSWVFVQGPPSGQAQSAKPEPCDTEAYSPKTDIGFAIATGLFGIGAAVILAAGGKATAHTAGGSIDLPAVAGYALAGATALAAIPFGFSARDGYRRLAACRAYLAGFPSATRLPGSEENDCRRACEHGADLLRQAVARSPRAAGAVNPEDTKRSFAIFRHQREAWGERACAEACSAGGLDTACALAAKTHVELIPCLRAIGQRVR
jgi:hypothetical protein